MIYTSTPTHICVRIYMYGLWRIYYVYKWMRCVHRLETHKIYSSLKVLSGLVFLKLKQWWIFRPCVVCVAMWDSPTSFSDAPSAEAASNTRTLRKSLHAVKIYMHIKDGDQNFFLMVLWMNFLFCIIWFSVKVKYEQPTSPLAPNSDIICIIYYIQQPRVCNSTTP